MDLQLGGGTVAHKTMVNGTQYEVSRGKMIKDGTVYAVVDGRTMVDGTVYKITFERRRINFFIESTYYAAYEGMTWREWCNSKFNTCDAYISTTNYVESYHSNYGYRRIAYKGSNGDYRRVGGNDRVGNGQRYYWI